MERELRELLRAAAAQAGDGLDVADLRERAGRVRRRRRLRTAGLVFAAVVAVGVPAVLVGSRVTPSLEVLVEPAPTADDPPEATASPADPIRAPDEVAVPVRAAELVEDVAGWAATDDGLYWTLNGGGSWIEVTPRGVDPRELRGTTFLDRVHGWTVDLPGEQGGQAQVWRTTDGGNAWRSSTIDLPAPPVGAYGGVVVEFVDPQHGWLLVELPWGMSSETGELFATSDGGRSWRRLATVPVAEDLSFSSLNDGWLSGGVPTSGPIELYVTRDGGRSWQEAPIPVPEGWQHARAVTTVPLWWSAEEAALAVGLADDQNDVTEDDDRGAIAVFETADAGRTWQLADLGEVSATAAGCCGAPPFDLTGRGGWIAASSDGSAVLTSADHRPAARRLPSPLVSLSFADPFNSGWVLTLTGTGCSFGEGACLALLDEQNGRWVPLEPGRGPQPAGCGRDATRRKAPPDRDPATLDLYFVCGGDQVAIPPAVYRLTRPAPGEAGSIDERVAATLRAWLRGPTAEERAAGYDNRLPGLGPDLLKGVDVEDGTVIVHLGAPLRTVNNLGTSHAGSYFVRQIATTVFGTDAAIERVRFTLDGSCEAFSDIFQADPCQVFERRRFADLPDP